MPECIILERNSKIVWWPIQRSATFPSGFTRYSYIWLFWVFQLIKIAVFVFFFQEYPTNFRRSNWDYNKLSWSFLETVLFLGYGIRDFWRKLILFIPAKEHVSIFSNYFMDVCYFYHSVYIRILSVGCCTIHTYLFIGYHGNFFCIYIYIWEEYSSQNLSDSLATYSSISFSCNAKSFIEILKEKKIEVLSFVVILIVRVSGKNAH